MRNANALANLRRSAAEAMYMPRSPGEEGGADFVPVARNYYIDPVNGSDNNNGFTPETALKTYAELQQRFGRFTTLFIPPGPQQNPPQPPDPPHNDVTISNITAGPGGQILVTTSAPLVGVVTDNLVMVSGLFTSIIGTTEAYGLWKVKVIAPNEILLLGSTFVNAYGGGGNVLTPALKLVTIFLLGDLPISDPITFYNFIGINTTVLVQGQQTVLHTGTVTAVQVENEKTNTPWTITDPTIPNWTPNLFLTQVQFLTGAAGPLTPQDIYGGRAYPVIDLGGGQVQLSEICQSDPVANIPLGNWVPGDTFFVVGNPAPGDQYRLVSFTKAVFGTCLVGADTAGDESQSSGPDGAFGGLVLQNIHIITPPVTTPAPFANTAEAFGGMLPLTDSSITAYADCIFDSFLIVFNGGYSFVTNDSFFNTFGTFYPKGQESGTVWSFGCVGQSIIDCEPGSLVPMDGNVSFVGANGNGSDSSLYIGGFTVGGNASVTAGPIQFWNNSNTSLFILPNSSLNFQLFSPLFAQMNFPILWGDCSATASSTNVMDQLSSINAVHFSPTTAAIVPPLLKDGFADMLAGPVANIFLPSAIEAYAFDPATGTSVPGLRPFTWASLIVPVGGGGFQQAPQSIGFPPAYIAVGGAYRPDAPFSGIDFSVFVFPGP